MNVFTNMARPPTAPFAILLLPTISAVFGCGVMPAGQEPDVANNNDHYCIVASNTVTGICTVKMKGKDKKCSMMNDETIASVPDNHTSISGTLSVRSAVYLKVIRFVKKRGSVRPQTSSWRIGRE
ncbi:hypothetical protein KIN20_022327 [Parelaphostrongylus tenuis]|uniref:Lipoprotein n=1 Tax=Parelaphostrongylus tenuis TaxID=148309 RepID=A0AAD5QV43_PARTN|nr:hypothetical protein KIN20_022327 [Parelaphostrongylus tenuis]